ncbi:MAG: hypothetical protein M5U26_27485 [Planctomycetota bacterium]|nr:hypothetical protein [Planctomycetota bacterium]
MDARPPQARASPRAPPDLPRTPPCPSLPPAPCAPPAPPRPSGSRRPRRAANPATTWASSEAPPPEAPAAPPDPAAAWIEALPEAERQELEVLVYALRSPSPRHGPAPRPAPPPTPPPPVARAARPVPAVPPEPSPKNPEPAPPLWQRLAPLQDRGATSIHVRRHALHRLAAFVLLWLRAERDEAAAAADTQSVLPAREPGYELAELLGLPESALNRLCRERTGQTAREWWDLLRAPALVEALKEDARAWLDGEPFPPGRNSDKRRPGAGRILHALQRRRREAGRSRQERAWALGFRNAARLDRALYLAAGRTAAALDAEVAAEAQAGWYFDPGACRLWRAEAPGEREREARRAAFLSSRTGSLGKPGIWVPNPRPDPRNPFIFEPLTDWNSVVSYCQRRELDPAVLVIHNARFSAETRPGKDFGREAARWLGYSMEEIDRAAGALDAFRAEHGLAPEGREDLLRAVFDKNYDPDEDRWSN